MDAVRRHHLIVLGRDAWLAKGQRPGAGSIVLVHPNGNEKAASTVSIAISTRACSRARWSRCSRRPEGASAAVQFSPHVFRHRLRLEPPVLVAHRPDSFFVGLDRQFPPLNSLWSISKLIARQRHARYDFDLLAELRGAQKIRARIDQRNAGDAIGAATYRLLHAKRGSQQQRRRPVEKFEEARIEDDAGGVAMTPFDRQFARGIASPMPGYPFALSGAATFSINMAMPCPPPMQAEAMP